jgi:cytosine/adenosine deaminase-related metal-dependent hydrolase
MRKISAHLILDGKGKCYSKGILSLGQDGTVLDIEDTGGDLRESAEVEFFSGAIVPGFVNAHCHLELSHMLDSFQEGTGFVPFLKQVVSKRSVEPEIIVRAAEKADLMMYKNGIVAVGDISNETLSFGVKKDSKIDYYTFVEALGFSPLRAENAFERAKNCLTTARSLGLKASIVPHAPYSVSTPLFNAIATESQSSDSILSLHSQESVEEDELYQTGRSGLSDHLRENLGIDTTFFVPTGESALRSILKLLPPKNYLLLIHNLYTRQSDLDYINSVRSLGKTWLVLCPGSNLYIQKLLPDVMLLRKNNLQICLGTDSLVSNHLLSILEEMKILQRAFPELTMDELTTWATHNGATALKINDWAGSIEVGKRPGINLLTGLNLADKKLLPGTGVRKLI